MRTLLLYAGGGTIDLRYRPDKIAMGLPFGDEPSALESFVKLAR